MSSPRQAYWQGFRQGVPFIIVIVPFGTLFGVVATEAGMDIVETMVMTSLVIAGASQFAAVSLLSDNAPALVAILTGLAVNLRMALYSVSLVPHLGPAPVWQRSLVAYFMVDQTYAISVREYENQPEKSVGWKVAFYFGTVTPIVPIWLIFSYVGAVVGEAIPPEYALDFALPIMFIALFAPAMRSMPHIGAALVSVITALLLVTLPFNLGLMIAAILAMVTGAELERRLNS